MARHAPHIFDTLHFPLLVQRQIDEALKLVSRRTPRARCTPFLWRGAPRLWECLDGDDTYHQHRPNTKCALFQFTATGVKLHNTINQDPNQGPKPSPSHTATTKYKNHVSQQLQ